MITASDRAVVGFSLSGAEADDLPQGIALLECVKRQNGQTYI